MRRRQASEHFPAIGGARKVTSSESQSNLANADKVRDDRRDGRVLVLLTGGTMAMKPNARGSLEPRKGYLAEQMRLMPELRERRMPARAARAHILAVSFGARPDRLSRRRRMGRDAAAAGTRIVRGRVAAVRRRKRNRPSPTPEYHRRRGSERRARRCTLETSWRVGVLAFATDLDPREGAGAVAAAAPGPGGSAVAARWSDVALFASAATVSVGAAAYGDGRLEILHETVVDARGGRAP